MTLTNTIVSEHFSYYNYKLGGLKHLSLREVQAIIMSIMIFIVEIRFLVV